MNYRIILISCLVVFPVTAAQAQELPQLPGPAKEHQWLKQFVGEWSTKSKAKLGPGQPDLEGEGSISSRMIGGFWVINEMKAEMAGTSVEGIQTVGYDADKKMYVGTWVDGMSDHLWHYTGSVDEAGKVLTLEAKGPNIMADGKLSNYQDIYEFVSPDEIAFKSTMQGDDGEWITFMSGTAKRKKHDQEK